MRRLEPGKRLSVYVKAQDGAFSSLEPNLQTPPPNHQNKFVLQKHWIRTKTSSINLKFRLTKAIYLLFLRYVELLKMLSG